MRAFIHDLWRKLQSRYPVLAEVGPRRVISLFVGALLLGLAAIVGRAFVLRGQVGQLALSPTPTFITPTQAIASATPSSTPSPTRTATPTQAVTFSTKSTVVTLKTGPDTKFPNASPAYPKNTQLVILGRYHDWFYVRAPDGVEGWAYSTWLNITGDLSIIPLTGNVPVIPPTQVHKKKTYP